MAREVSTVAMVFNRYRIRGGEERVFESEVRLLRENGIRVIPVVEQTTLPSNLQQKMAMARNSFWSGKWYEALRVLLVSNDIDVVHVHNSFPIMSPSIYHACYKNGVPVVQTLHNYRLLCPQASLYRNGRACHDCVGRLPWPAFLHACYHSSRSQTAVVAAMLGGHRLIGTWRERVNVFIALSMFAKAKFVQAGIPPHKIVVKPNFYDGETFGTLGTERSGALFVGRFTEDKGIRTLLRAWRGSTTPLRAVGDGPLLAEAEQTDMPSVSLLGWKSEQDVSAEMARASFLVVPSHLYEGSPMVIQEAFAHGLPVIASRLGSLAEIVRDGRTGLHFEAGDAQDLAEKVRWAEAHRNEMEQMGRNARLEHERKYTPERNFDMLMDIYQHVIQGRNNDQMVALH